MPPRYQEDGQRTFPTHESKGCLTMRWRCPLQGWATLSGCLHSVLFLTWGRFSSIPLSYPGILSGPCSQMPALVDTPWLNLLWCVLHGWTESSLHGFLWLNPASILPPRPRKVLLLTPRRSNNFWLLLFPSASALQFRLSPSLAHILWVLLYLQVCPCLSLLPATLPASLRAALLQQTEE